MYKYNSTKTYATWIDFKHVDEGESILDGDIIFSNYSMKENGTIEASGEIFRLYSERVIMTYSDSYFLSVKEKNPDAEQSTQVEWYYAVI